MSRLAFVDGQYVPFAQAGVHVEDRGLQFADSIYEVFAITDGKPLDEAGHWARLERSLGELSQGIPMSRAAFAGHLRRMIHVNRIRYGLVYVQVTRGVVRRDHPFPAEPIAQTVIMTARQTSAVKARDLAAKGVGVKTMPDLRWGRCDIKTTGLTANVLAKQEARASGAYEAWLVGADGKVTEGASSNAWIIDAAGNLITRDLSNAILPGITRTSIMRLARERQIAVVERAFTVDEAKAAKEAFITSAGAFVMPVVAIDGTPVGGGKPGPVASALRADYLAAGTATA
ncbi:D-alanine aminotransferase [Alphaproteobacteria bacterium SO-S41]|nr:D-alanine aminotransferase [Alphaproteobacteria bacterium SO-S41]